MITLGFHWAVHVQTIIFVPLPHQNLMQKCLLNRRSIACATRRRYTVTDVIGQDGVVGKSRGVTIIVFMMKILSRITQKTRVVVIIWRLLHIPGRCQHFKKVFQNSTNWENDVIRTNNSPSQIVQKKLQQKVPSSLRIYAKEKTNFTFLSTAFYSTEKIKGKIFYTDCTDIIIFKRLGNPNVVLELFPSLLSLSTFLKVTFIEFIEFSQGCLQCVEINKEPTWASVFFRVRVDNTRCHLIKGSI